MPPKQQQAKGAKVKDDKTFGIKNKNKSSKVQKFIQQVDQQVKMTGKNKEELAKEKAAQDRAVAKLADEKRRKEEAALMNRPIQSQKVPFGVDPKTVLCVFFKSGHCEKGNKCKFSHDKNIERKAQKANLYEDVRDTKKDEKAADTMEKWDEEKLRSVVLSKTGNPKTTTDIVCKYFIQAIEDQKYGWFWECPNGLDCKYRHALPPGFVLKADKKAKEDAAKNEVISLEDFLETERHKLKQPLTPVTPENFAIWKKTRVDKKVAEQEAKEKAKAAQRAAGKISGMSGKDLFDYSADLFEDDADEDDEDDWDLQRYLASREDAEREDEDDEEPGDDNDDSDAEGTQATVEGSDKALNDSTADLSARTAALPPAA